MTIIESVLPAIAKPLYRAISGTTADEIRLVYRGSAWWLLIKDGKITKLVRIPHGDIEMFSSCCITQTAVKNKTGLYPRTAELILEEKTPKWKARSNSATDRKTLYLSLL